MASNKWWSPDVATSFLCIHTGWNVEPVWTCRKTGPSVARLSYPGCQYYKAFMHRVLVHDNHCWVLLSFCHAPFITQASHPHRSCRAVWRSFVTRGWVPKLGVLGYELSVCDRMHGLTSFAIPNPWHKRASRALKSPLPNRTSLIASIKEINKWKPTRQATTLNSSVIYLMILGAMVQSGWPNVTKQVFWPALPYCTLG